MHSKFHLVHRGAVRQASALKNEKVEADVSQRLAEECSFLNNAAGCFLCMNTASFESMQLLLFCWVEGGSHSKQLCVCVDSILILTAHTVVTLLSLDLKLCKVMQHFYILILPPF